MIDRKQKLSALGREVESFLARLLKKVKDDNVSELGDRLAVLDRALKWEAIKMKGQEDEGEFFSQDEKPEDQDDDVDERVEDGIRRASSGRVRKGRV